MGPTPLTREVIKRIGEISKDRVHGASFLGAEAVRALAMAARAHPAGHGRTEAVVEAGRGLSRARPAIAAIRNMARRFTQRAEAMGGRFDPDALAGALLGEMEAASSKAAFRAAEYVDEGARVVTCSYSSAVLSTFQASHKQFSVTAIESLVSGIAYGPRVVEELLVQGIPCGLVPDDAVAEGVAKADMALVGADKLLQDAGIVNGWPSLRLAERCAGRIPFYVVAESFKLDTDPSTEEGFDLVPASLITAIIMDVGP